MFGKQIRNGSEAFGIRRILGLSATTPSYDVKAIVSTLANEHRVNEAREGREQEIQRNYQTRIRAAANAGWTFEEHLSGWVANKRVGTTIESRYRETMKSLLDVIANWEQAHSR